MENLFDENSEKLYTKKCKISDKELIKKLNKIIFEKDIQIERLIKLLAEKELKKNL